MKWHATEVVAALTPDNPPISPSLPQDLRARCPVLGRWVRSSTGDRMGASGLLPSRPRVSRSASIGPPADRGSLRPHP